MSRDVALVVVLPYSNQSNCHKTSMADHAPQVKTPNIAAYDTKTARHSVQYLTFPLLDTVCVQPTTSPSTRHRTRYHTEVSPLSPPPCLTPLTVPPASVIHRTNV